MRPGTLLITSFLVSFFLLTLKLNAQFYSPVLHQDTLYYGLVQTDTLLESITIDSISSAGSQWEGRLTPGFYNNQSWGECRDSTFFGYRVTQNADSTWFHQSDGDVFLIQHTAGIGDTFIFFVSNSKIFHLVCTEVSYMKWPYGTYDSIKTFSFLVTDTSGAKISHTFQGKSLFLSKSHGLVKAFDFSLFPDWALAYYQFGHEGEWGFQNFTAREIFDFDVGDEFHRSSVKGDIGFSHITNRWIIQILSKKVTNGGQTLEYEVHKIERGSYWTQNTDTPIYHYYDTVVTLTYHLPDYDFLNAIPSRLDSNGNQYMPVGGLVSNAYGYIKTFPTYFSQFEMGCLSYPSGHGIYFTDHYAPGLGKVGWRESSFHTGRMDLVYYKKGNTIWGTPLQIFPLGVEQPNLQHSLIDLSWNVHSGQLYLYNQDTKAQSFNIIAMDGRVVRTGIIPPLQKHIETLSDLTSAIYLVHFPESQFTEKILIP